MKKKYWSFISNLEQNANIYFHLLFYLFNLNI